MQDGALGVQPLCHFSHLRIKQVWAADMQIEQARAVLVADLQKIAKSFGDEEKNPLALALQQGIGGHCGTHLHRPD